MLAAKKLGLTEVPIERVELPFAGYKTIEDLFNYLITEFKMTEFRVIMNDEIDYISFWSDLL